MPYSTASPHTALFQCPDQPIKKEPLASSSSQSFLSTYKEFGQSEVADFNLTIGVDEDIVTLDVAMDDPQIVHIGVNAGAVQGDLHSLGQGQLYVALHVQHVEQTVVYQFVHDYDVRDRWRATHQKGDVRVSQNTLHDDFILDFSKQFIRDVRVENFLDRHRSSI